MQIDQLLGRLTLIVVLLSALPLGSNRPVWWLMLAIAIAVFFAFQIALDVRRGIDTPARVALLPMSACVLILGWAMVQTMLPVGAGWQHPVWSLVESDAEYISADPVNGRHQVVRMGTYSMVFWIAVRSSSNSVFAAWALQVIALVTAGLCVYGLIAYLLGPNPLLGELASEFVSGSFVNRNNFATYAVIALLANMTVFSRLKVDLPSGNSLGIRDFLEVFFEIGWLFASAVLFCLAAILLSQSRAGLGAAIIGIAVYALTRQRQGTQKHYAALFVVVIVTAALVAFSSDTVSRIFTTSSEELRFAIYPLVVEGISDRPFLGHGAGAFHDAFRSYVTAEMSEREIDLAHSSYLENAFELGVPAAVLLYVTLGLVVAVIFSGMQRRRRNRHFTRFAFCVVVAAAFHAFFDFSLQIPAIAALFAFILGMGWAQSFSANERA